MVSDHFVLLGKVVEDYEYTLSVYFKEILSLICGDKFQNV